MLLLFLSGFSSYYSTETPLIIIILHIHTLHNDIMYSYTYHKIGTLDIIDFCVIRKHKLYLEWCSDRHCGCYKLNL